jgi:hypothetical protein
MGDGSQGLVLLKQVQLHYRSPVVENRLALGSKLPLLIEQIGVLLDSHSRDFAAHSNRYSRFSSYYFRSYFSVGSHC